MGVMETSFDWIAIEQEYCFGKLSIRAIARANGCSDAAIRKKAKSLKWRREYTGIENTARKQKTNGFVLDRLGSIENNERGVMTILSLFAHTGKLANVVGTPPIEKFVFELQLPKGRADMVLFHRDGSVTIVEAKGDNGYSLVVAGIGQLLFYAAQLGLSGTYTKIRKILIAPSRGVSSVSYLIDKACSEAGVSFVPLGTIKEYTTVFENVLREMIPEALNGK